MLLKKSGIKERLLAKAKIISEQTSKKHEEVTKKRQKRRGNKTGETGIKSSVPNFCQVGEIPLENIGKKSKDGQTQKNDIRWWHVLCWFQREIVRHNNEHGTDWKIVDEEYFTEEKQTVWAWPEKNCANRLLKHYGPSDVEQTVVWFFDNWQAMKDRSEGDLTGSPSVRFLWSCRDRVFSEAKEGKTIGPKKRKPRKKKHLVGEYNAESAAKLPGIGWGDED